MFRTDVKGYYANIDHFQLRAMLAGKIRDRAVLRLLDDYIQCTLCDGGDFRTLKRGITRGCPVAPLLGALYLQDLDTAMGGRDLLYVRCMCAIWMTG